MTDWEKKIKDSADQVEVPESLKPESIEKKLQNKELQNLPKSRQVPFYQRPAVGICAAAALLLCIGLGTKMAGLWNRESEGGTEASVELAAADQEIAETADTDGAEIMKEENQDDQESANSGSEEDTEGKVDISGYYHTSSYDAIKEMVKNTLESSYDGGTREYATAESKDMGIAVDSSAADGADTSSTAADSAGQESMTAGNDYADTNLQVEGVDEGDYVKTDGTYIYILNSDTVKIVDAAKMEVAATIEQNPEEEFSFQEMYVDGSKLILAGTVYGGDLVEMEDDVYAINQQEETILQIYNISNMDNIRKIKELRQDGAYETSRKIGDVVYLFSEYHCYLEEETKENAWLPLVDGSVVKEDSIYVPDDGRGSQYLVMSAIDLSKSGKILDQKSILNSGNDFYITQNSVYIMQTNGSVSGTIYTVLIRFSLEKGEMKACAAVSLRGQLTDTFAIYESDGYLKVLLTDWSAGAFSQVTPSNRVYVVDEDMKIVGKISGIAPGETIYSARFIGDLGYFVTYRNTDPLFTVDFSDPENPKLIGELEVTGFSDYLHFYSEDLLLGLGWETDADTGNTVGLKLSMYDVSDPENVTEKHKVIIKDVDYCIALDQYKELLVNPENNLIGFAAEDYGDGFSVPSLRYVVFSYDEKDGFVKKMDYSHSDKKVGYDLWEYWMRGLFIRDSFYVAEPEQITVFDRNNDFKKSGSLALS